MEGATSSKKDLVGAWIKVSTLFAGIKILSDIVIDRGFYSEKIGEYLIDVAIAFFLVGLIIAVVFMIGRLMYNPQKKTK